MCDVQGNLLLPSSCDQKIISIDEELWLMVEERAQEIICIVQPNVISEANRNKIIDFVRRLVGGCCGGEAFVFGSVPLKTYLPDGDIDFTIFSHESVEDDLPQAVCNLLESAHDLEYEVKDIQYIRAQVKVVKCTVKNIAVDISFNQMGGLYALRFLEQVDELVGKNHIFKRSIILVKTWCYYESRILGAYHGLLSTYAVEILVLYIINCFNASLRGPLEVLYRFLDYYSTFDWDKNYITIDGPQALSSLPEIVEKPECDRGGLFLSKELVNLYRDMCSGPKASGTLPREFSIKFMNILDPLKNDNNLGRSVSQCNLSRIKFALKLGARKLKEILKLPGQSMGGALEVFFMNTLNRNGKGQRPDTDVPVPAFGTGNSEESVLLGDCNSYYGGLQYVQLYRNHAKPLVAHPSSLSIPFDDVAHSCFPSIPSDVVAHSSSPLIPFDNVVHSSFPSIPSDVVAHSSHPSIPFNDVAHSSSASIQFDADLLALQQNWYMYYYGGSDIYVPNETFFPPNAPLPPLPPTYNLDDIGKSRGTGTYIPDMTHSTYWNVRARGFRPRRSSHENNGHANGQNNNNNNNASPKLSERKKIEEVLPETNIDDNNSKSFDLSNEYFPFLKNIGNTSSSTETEQDQNSTLLTKLSLRTKIQKEDSSVSSSQGIVPVVPETNMNDNNSKSFELSNEYFPILSIGNTSSPAYKKFEQDQNSAPLTKPSLRTKDQKSSSNVSSSQGAAPFVPSLAVEAKEKYTRIEEKMN